MLRSTRIGSTARSFRQAESSTGTLYEKMYDTEPLNNLIERTVANPVGEDAQRIAALYTNILDWDARNMAGIEPIRPYLEAAEAAQRA